MIRIVLPLQNSHCNAGPVLNKMVANQGGIDVDDGMSVASLPLPIAGLMSNSPAAIVAARYASLDSSIKALGSPSRAPFMTLSLHGSAGYITIEAQ